MATDTLTVLLNEKNLMKFYSLESILKVNR